MNRSLANISLSAATLFVLVGSRPIHAVTATFNREVEMNDGNELPNNRPFFTLGGPDGYVGTAVSGGTNTSTEVTNANVGLGGNLAPANTSNNNMPLGVGLDFGVKFTVATNNPGHVLADGGNAGLAVNSGVGDPNPSELSTGEQLQFSTIQLTNLSIYDPLGLLMPNPTFTPRWKALRSSTFSGSDAAKITNDAAGNDIVKTFLGNNPATPPPPTNNERDIQNNYTRGVFGPLDTFYLTTTAGNWPLKGVRYEVAMEYQLAPAPAARRTFQFGGTYGPVAPAAPVTSHQLTAGDTTISFSAVGGADARLDTNGLGVGVNSDEDNLTGGITTGDAAQRFIDGSLTTPESIRFSFDRKVELESLTLGNLDLNGTEGVKLEFVSGTNPFTGLTGYSGNYALAANSLTFNSNAGGQTPYAITYGKNGQGKLLIEAGTVLSLTSSPSAGNGFILDMMTVNIPGTTPVFDADFNDDGDVDAADLDVWADHFGEINATITTGDTDDDDDADGADFLRWQRDFTGPLPVATAAPEPGAAALCMLAAPFARFARRRNL